MMFALSASVTTICALRGRSVFGKYRTGVRGVIAAIFMTLSVIASDSCAFSPSLRSSSVPNSWLQVLSAEDVVAYKMAREAQNMQNWQMADAALWSVKDRRLVGSILAERYLGKGYHSGYDELRIWLISYGQEARAYKIRRLAQARYPGNGALPLPPPVSSSVPVTTTSALMQFSDDDNSDWRLLPTGPAEGAPMLAGDRALRHMVRSAISLNRVEDAVVAVTAAEVVRSATTPIIDQMRAEVGRALFSNGNVKAAAEVTVPALRSAGVAPYAAWISGLAEWRIGNKAKALRYFRAVALSPASPPCAAAGAAYWAARSHFVTGQLKGYDEMLERAAKASRCFYGLVAKRALGGALVLDGHSIEDIDVVVKNDSRLSRAVALLQIGDSTGASEELQAIAETTDPTSDVALATAILAVKSGQPSTAMRLAGLIARQGGQRLDAALYPIPPWEPASGFNVNPALIYAVMRVESHFKIRAVSAAGAVGLMQIMPETARMVGTKGQTLDKLMEPETNLGLAQRYINTLLGTDVVGGSLFHLAAAYNGGPGSVSKWREQMADSNDDPLLFLESVPLAETRVFIQRVLTYYWIYQMQLGQTPSSLDTLVVGGWPLYDAMGDMRREVAEHGN